MRLLGKLVFVLLSFSGPLNAQGQDVEEPEMTLEDSVSIDSFYLRKQIDLKLCDNPALYYEIYKHYGTCYRYGRQGNGGFDCSGFVKIIYAAIYQKELPHSASGMFPLCKILPKNDTPAEGDLVFFKIKKNRISHVGIYLQHNKFAHASTRSGIVISDLDEDYYKRRFYKAGRVE